MRCEVSSTFWIFHIWLKLKNKRDKKELKCLSRNRWSDFMLEYQIRFHFWQPATTASIMTILDATCFSIWTSLSLDNEQINYLHVIIKNKFCGNGFVWGFTLVSNYGWTWWDFKCSIVFKLLEGSLDDSLPV